MHAKQAKFTAVTQGYVTRQLTCHTYNEDKYCLLELTVARISSFAAL